MTADPLAWETLESRVAYSCPGFDIVNESVQLPDGTETEFDYLSEPPSVCVLPFTPTATSSVSKSGDRPSTESTADSPPAAPNPATTISRKQLVANSPRRRATRPIGSSRWSLSNRRTESPTPFYTCSSPTAVVRRPNSNSTTTRYSGYCDSVRRTPRLPPRAISATVGRFSRSPTIVCPPSEFAVDTVEARYRSLGFRVGANGRVGPPIFRRQGTRQQPPAADSGCRLPIVPCRPQTVDAGRW